MSSLGGSTVSSSYNRLLVLPAGGGDANNLVTLSDGDNATTFALKISTGGIAVDTNDKIYLDNGGDTYIYESADDILDFYAGGNKMLRLNHSGDANSVFVTADYLQIFDKDASSPKINIGSKTGTDTIDGTSRTIHEISIGGDGYSTALLQLGRASGGHSVSVMGALYVTSANGTGGDAMIRFRGHKNDVRTPLWRISVDESNYDKLKFFDEVNGIYRMALTQDGYLGVGTDAPIRPLDVRGITRFGGPHLMAKTNLTIASGVLDISSTQGPYIAAYAEQGVGSDNADTITHIKIDGAEPTVGTMIYLTRAGNDTITLTCLGAEASTIRCFYSETDDEATSEASSVVIGNAYEVVQLLYTEAYRWTVMNPSAVRVND